MGRLAVAIVLIIHLTSFPMPAADDVAATIQALEDARERRIAGVRSEREKVIIQLREQESLVGYLRTWAESETDRRLRARPLQRSDSKYLESIKKRRELMLSRITNFPFESRGGIVKGTALNELLIACGPTAVSRLRLRKQGVPVAPNNEPVIDEVQRLFAESAPFDPSVLEHIRFRRGLTGPKLTGRLNGTVLDLDWPIKLREDVYQTWRQDIERARDKAFKELEAGKPISPATAAELMVAVEELKRRIVKDGARNIRVYHDYQKYRHFQIASQHVDLLMQGASRFIYATKPEHVKVATFEGKSVEEFIAYMHTNTLQFAPADPNGEEAYWRVFESMMTWFIDMQLIDMAVSHEQKELDALRQRDKQLQQMEDSIRTSAGPAIITAIQALSQLGSP